jgi:HK97 family phage major capsid protein
MQIRTRPLKLRSATPAADGDVHTRTATPPATPPANPPAQRTAAELTTERARLIADAEALQTRSLTETLSPEDEARLDQCIAEAERIHGELNRMNRQQRITAQRSSLAQPTAPAPVFTPAQRIPATAANAEAEALRIWLRSFTEDAERAPDAVHRAAQAGFHVGSSTARFGSADVSSINRAKLRTLSTGGAGTGAEVVPAKTYSGKVLEYIGYYSPFLGFLDSETTADGVKRAYFKIDDTALTSSYITASSGTELAPTIPDKDIATGAVDISTFDITSGYHKITRQELRDSAITLTDKVTKAIGNSHRRRIEADVINGTGNGVTGVQGLLAAAAVYGDPVAEADIDAELFEGLYFSVPQQYRGECIFLFSDTGMAKAVSKLKTTTGESLFGKTMMDGAEIRTLFGRPVFTSAHMPAFDFEAKPFLFFNPLHYMLRMVSDQTIDVLREKFYPHLAYAGGMAFGGAWRGPTGASGTVKCIEIEAEA